ncbi:MAG: AAA family ATPase [Candidatus Stygibacter frigidus]|nr:AAA family ATPase [Candidatus Stygibacter frigidus]
MIKELYISNFRGISELMINDFKKVNLFVGNNNSGKSTILESIFLNIGATNPGLFRNINLFRQFAMLDSKILMSFFHNFNLDNDITINTIIKNPKQYRNLSISPIYNEYGNSKIVKLSDNDSSENSLTYFSYIKGLENRLDYKESTKGKSDKVISRMLIDNPEIRIELPQNYSEKLFGVFIPPRKYIQDTVNRLENIKFKKEEATLIQILQEIEPELKSLEILANNVIAADIGRKNLIPINLMGDGINRLLVIILAIYDKKDGYILIDEIENGFHHKTLSTLWKAVFKAAEMLNVQIFATTHSWENIIKFNQVAVEESYKNVMLYRIEHKNDKNKAISYELDVLTQTIQSNWELR